MRPCSACFGPAKSEAEEGNVSAVSSWTGFAGMPSGEG